MPNPLIALRLPPALLQQIDSYRDRLLSVCGIRPTRTAVIILFIERGLSKKPRGRRAGT